MGTITKTKTWADNENVTYTDINANFDTVYNEFNGGIDNANIDASAGIASSKISGTAVTLAGSETLTNKTLTTPTITTPTLQGTVTGWVLANETWTYASALSVTVPTGAANKYNIGDKVKLTQTTVRYFYIATVADTVLTFVPNDDYTVDNAAITLNYYSKSENAVGFPDWFEYTPTWTGFNSDPSQPLVYSIKGRMCYVVLDVNGSSNSATFNFTLPVARDNSYNGGQSFNFLVGIIDNTTDQANPGIIGLTDAGTAKVGKTYSTRASNAYGGFTTSGTKGCEGMFSYPI